MKPTTRRKFIAGTAQAGLASLAALPLYKLLRRAEVSAAVGQCNLGSGPIPFSDRRVFMTLSMPGGAQLPAFICPVDSNGALWNSSRDMSLMGLGLAGTNRVIQTVGASGSTHPLYESHGGTPSGFYQALMSNLNPAVIPNIHFTFIHGAIPDDNTNIKLCPTYGQRVQQGFAGNEAPLFSNGVGNNLANKGFTYGSAIEQRDLSGAPDYSSAIVGEMNGLKASAVAPDRFNQLDPATRAEFFGALEQLGRRQLPKYIGQSLAETVADIYACNLSKGVNAVNSGLASQLDVRLNPGIVNYFASFGQNIQSYTDSDSRLLALSMAHLQGSGLSLASNLDPFQPFTSSVDYHFGGVISDAINGNTIIAQHLADLINMIYYYGTPGVITLLTDGGCTTSAGQYAPLQYFSDRGEASGIIQVSVNPVTPPVRTSLGHYSTYGQGAETSGVLSWSGNHELVALIAFYNSLRFMGYNSSTIAPPILAYLRDRLGNNLNALDMTMSG